MKLFLCEKPSQGNDIAKVLGAGTRANGCLFTADKQICVTWGIGHLVEQFQPEEYDPAFKRWSFETLPIIPSQWKLSPKKETKKQYNVVMSLIKKANSVIISTDADREGEMIARELLDIAGFKGQIFRLWLSALDDESIRKALSALKSGKETESLYYAGIGRSRSDWLIGMNFSRLFTLLAQQQGYQGSPLSVGRVQSPTLAMVVNRDREIANFIPKSHFVLITQLQTQQNQTFLAKYVVPENYLDADELCLNEPYIQQVNRDIQNIGTAIVKTVETKREKNVPPLLFALSDLQSECNRLFGMGAQQVLDIAQALYEKHKATTYPRTDCGYLPESQFKDAPKVLSTIIKVNSNWQKILPNLNVIQKSRAWNDKKITAHHGIIPTMGNVDLSVMNDDELKIYDLICRRYLAQFLPYFEVDKTLVQLQCGRHILQARGNLIIANGWKALFGNMKESEADDNQGIPSLSKNQNCQIILSEVKALKTTPPAHYTEGTLLSAMKNAARFVTDERLKQRLRETEGLGTEATRAGLIQGLIDKNFLKKKGKKILATEQANVLIDSLPDLLKNPGLTALWEQALNQIAEGSMTLADFMKKQENFIRMLMNNCLKQGINLGKIEIRKCPLCGKPMRKIQHTKGTFWGCSGYPECQHKEADKKSVSKAKKSSSANVTQQIANLRSLIK
ncbi:DNA topoisomerase-3 [Bisgaardia hudsonensis]|uniref:DNA topoisomerase n=1 Tax=Bisgaardia hudsonensis TaxID=109472 RepID=A0A4V2SJD2_9PAST|nr:DNA topoisomerase III [Bisgaardia hudsonensis]QLB12770.1 DNA topoisomerase III [Bisgaardia hudsonensis]TCP14320.1 DNA topoisomerase-3 [Bisgaardia hudsonensis]